MTTPLLEVAALRKEFNVRPSFGRLSRKGVQPVRAVDDVDLRVEKGAILGLVGESGCGKSTLARCIVGIYAPTSGSISLDGQVMGPRRDRSNLRRVQMIFQDPQSALDPRMTVRQTIGELLQAHRMVPKENITDRCRELLHLVGLGEEFMDAYPRRLSGGQKQRVSTARALALEPEVLVADEPTSALDVSVQAAILELFLHLNRSLELTVVFISHNMAVVRQISSHLAVMYLGRIVEEGETQEVFERPAHPYTQVLLSAVPRLIPGRASEAIMLTGDPPSSANIPTGCRFHPRCHLAQDICSIEDPALEEGPDKGHTAACHFAWAGTNR